MGSRYDDLLSLFVRRGFLWPAVDLYGGFAGFYDYGHLGAALKRKWEGVWLSYFLGLGDNYHLIDTTTILPAASAPTARTRRSSGSSRPSAARSPSASRSWAARTGTRSPPARARTGCGSSCRRSCRSSSTRRRRTRSSPRDRSPRTRSAWLS